jgi:3-dehydroquinate synthase class II
MPVVRRNMNWLRHPIRSSRYLLLLSTGDSVAIVKLAGRSKHQIS